MPADPTLRFSDRVDDYRRYRPGYPREILDVLARECHLASGLVVADIGCGTGIFTELLLRAGYQVFGVEPNDAMRTVAGELAADWPNLRLLAGTAEATGLPDASVDLITAAQAFHWFVRDRTRAEFRRILRSDGWVALIWNERRLTGTPFLREYEALLHEFGTDYVAVRRRDLDLDQIRAFAGHDAVSLVNLESRQILDFDEVKGRLLSSSYTPAEEDPKRAPMLARLAQMFEEHQQDGRVTIEYDTRVYCTRLP